jgi:hypothetical protein
MKVGVFGDKQNYAIQFSEGTAFIDNGIRVQGQNIERSIYTIPGGSEMKGNFLVTRLR